MFSFPIWMPFIIIFSLIALDRTSSTHWVEVARKNVFFPGLRKAFRILALSMMLALGFIRYCLSGLGSFFPFQFMNALTWQHFYHKFGQMLLKIIEIILWFLFFFSINTVYDIDEFWHVEITLHFRDKFWLIILYYLSLLYFLFFWINCVSIILRIFAYTFIRNIGL